MKGLHNLVLYGALISALCIIASVTAQGRGGGQRFKKCGEDEVNIEEMMKGRDTCMAQVNNSTEATTSTSVDPNGNDDEDNDRRRRRSPQAADSQPNEGGKGKGRGRGKGRGGGRGRGRGMGRNQLCAKVCQWKAVGLLDDKGSYSESGAEAYVGRVYPEKYRSNVTESLKACASEKSSKFSMDDNCSG